MIPWSTFFRIFVRVKVFGETEPYLGMIMENSMRYFLCAGLLCGSLLMGSCGGGRTVVQTLGRCDSLELVVRAKDSLINAVFADINAISENLALIRTREKLIRVGEEEESGRRPVAEIDRDIRAIDRLLQENRSKIASLQRSAALLRKADLRIDGLEKMIADLSGELGDKKSEVAQLQLSLSQRDAEVKSLSEEVSQRNAEVEALSGEKIELENRLTTVYYIVGAEKELRDAQIINKQGIIGRTLTVGHTGNLESFTMDNSRLLTEIPIGRKRVTLVTSHPEGSYELVVDADKIVRKLVITDPVHFWESSRILIVSYK